VVRGKYTHEIRGNGQIKTNAAAPGGGRPHKGEREEITPTRQSDTFRRAIRLLSGFADLSDNASAARVLASAVEMAPSEIDFCGQRPHAGTFEDKHCPTPYKRQSMVKRDSLLVEFFHFDRMARCRLIVHSQDSVGVIWHSHFPPIFLSREDLSLNVAKPCNHSSADLEDNRPVSRVRVEGFVTVRKLKVPKH